MRGVLCLKILKSKHGDWFGFEKASRTNSIAEYLIKVVCTISEDLKKSKKKFNLKSKICHAAVST